MTSVAFADGVDDIAAETDERAVLVVQVQGNGRDLKAPLHSRIAVLVIVVCDQAWRREQKRPQHERSDGDD